MNWKQVCSGILLGSLVSCTGSPGQAYYTTTQLNQAICIEDWEGAIAILDNIIPDYPNSHNTLAEYRDRLQQLSTTGLSEIHKLDYDCTEEPTPKTEETPLSDRVASYNEQIEYGMSYDETATIVGLPGKLNFVMSEYDWYDENWNALYYADFSNDRLNYLMVDEKKDCEDDNPNCDNIVAPAVEFKEIEARLEEEMNT